MKIRTTIIMDSNDILQAIADYLVKTGAVTSSMEVCNHEIHDKSIIVGIQEKVIPT